MKNECIALDTETYKGKAFILSHPHGVEKIERFSDFLAVLKRLEAKFYVFYNLDYDVSALLAHLPEKRWRKLFVEKEIEISQNFFMRYFPKKFWKIISGGKKFKIFDLYPFFQTSLDAALEKYGGGVNKMKISKRLLRNLSPEKYAKNKKVVDKYAIADAVGLQKLADDLLAALREIGIESENLYSPGYIAKVYLSKRNFNLGRLPFRYHEFVRSCYFGGMIQVFKRGRWKHAFNYDIKSAYPAALSELPDFSHARFFYSQKPETEIFFMKARVTMKKADFYLLPYRRKNTIVFPRFEKHVAFLTSYEYNYLVQNRLAEIVPIKTLNVELGKERPYGKIVRELFFKRKESGLKGLLYKLILNSMYGITAERKVGYETASDVSASYTYANKIKRIEYERFLSLQKRSCKEAERFWQKACECKICRDTRKIMRRLPGISKEIHELNGSLYRRTERLGRFQNFAIAALVTAKVRVKVFDAMRKAGKSCLAVFTDGILTSSPVRLKIGDKLGNWNLAGKGGLTLLGSGVYEFCGKTKLRGFHTKLSLDAILKKNAKTSFAKIPLFTRLSGMQIVRRNLSCDEIGFNEIFEDEKVLNINFDQKRLWRRNFSDCSEVFTRRISSQPYELGDL